MSKIRVVICDDVLQVREYFKKLINTQNDMEVVGTADSGENAVKVALDTKPDIILMDIQMESEYSGIEATRQIMDKCQGTKIIITTIHMEDEFIAEAYAAGAVDYIIKTTDKEEIGNSIRRVYCNNEFIRPFIARKLMNEFVKMHSQRKSFMYLITVLTSLTASELEILKSIYYGYSRKEIAAQRFIEPSTIKFHTRNILRKLQYNSTKDLVKDLKQLQIFESFHQI